jgi:hypothetical protein
MASIAQSNSLFEIDIELDGLLEEIQERVENEGEPSEDLVARFQQFCEAHGEKVDRIGRFVRMMEAREQFCRSEAARLNDRARAAAGKVDRTKNLVLYYLLSRDLKKIEGYQFTLRAQKNSQATASLRSLLAISSTCSNVAVTAERFQEASFTFMLPEVLFAPQGMGQRPFEFSIAGASGSGVSVPETGCSTRPFTSSASFCPAAASTCFPNEAV